MHRALNAAYAVFVGHLPPTILHVTYCKSETGWQHSEGYAALQKCRLSEAFGGYALQAAHESFAHGWCQQAAKLLFGFAAASIACGAVEAAEERLNPGIHSHPHVPLAACWTGTCLLMPARLHCQPTVHHHS